MNRIAAILTFACVVGLSFDAGARSHRVNQIPHGDSYGCTSCHTSPSGGGVFTGFGSDSLSFLVGDGHVSEQDIDWSQLVDRDSDRDGFTNGEELGDTAGEWSIGDPDPRGRHFNPGDPNDHPIATCGDGRVTPPEECDGTNHAGLSCFGLGLDEGPLTCKTDCTFDRSGCGGTPDMGASAPVDMGGASADSDVDDTACAVARSDTPHVTPWWLLTVVALTAARRRKR